MKYSTCIVTAIITAVLCAGCAQNTKAPNDQVTQTPSAQDQFTAPQRIEVSWKQTEGDTGGGSLALGSNGAERVELDGLDNDQVKFVRGRSSYLQINNFTFTTSADTTPTATQSPAVSGVAQSQEHTPTQHIDPGVAATLNIPVGPNSQASGSAAAAAGGGTVTLDAASTQRLTGQVLDAMTNDPKFLEQLGKAALQWVTPPPADANTSGVQASQAE